MTDAVQTWLDTLERIRLGRIECSEFVNEKHCLYAKQILSKKLGRLIEVWVGREYAVAVTEGPECYLVGRDSDNNLLFISKVVCYARDALGARQIEGRCFGNRTCRVYGVSDETVKSELLEYDHDVAGEATTISKPGSYRVQGEVVVTAHAITIDWSASQTAVIASKIAVADAVLTVLADHGIEARTHIPGVVDVALALAWTWIPTVRVHFLPRGQYSGRDVAVRIADLLAEGLSDLLGATLTRVLRDPGLPVLVVEPRKDGALEVLRISVGSGVYGTTTINVGVDAPPTALRGSVVGAVRGALLDYLRGGDAVDATLRLGRHEIELRHVKPTTLTLSTQRLVKLRYLGVRGVRVELADPSSFIVDTGSEVVLKHPRRGVRTLRFSGEFIVSVGHTVTTPDYEVNTIVLERLLESH